MDAVIRPKVQQKKSASPRRKSEHKKRDNSVHSEEEDMEKSVEKREREKRAKIKGKERSAENREKGKSVEKRKKEKYVEKGENERSVEKSEKYRAVEKTEHERSVEKTEHERNVEKVVKEKSADIEKVKSSERRHRKKRTNLEVKQENKHRRLNTASEPNNNIIIVKMKKKRNKLSSSHSTTSRNSSQHKHLSNPSKLSLYKKIHESCFSTNPTGPTIPSDQINLLSASSISRPSSHKSTSPKSTATSLKSNRSGNPTPTILESLSKIGNSIRPSDIIKNNISECPLKCTTTVETKVSRSSREAPKRTTPKCLTPKVSMRKTSEETYQTLKETADRAIREKKTFTVCGNYLSVRKALVIRGWVEKIHINNHTPDREHLRRLLSQSLNELILFVNDKTNGNLYKRAILTKLLGKHQVDLFWDYGGDAYKVNSDNVKFTMINNIRRCIYSYSTKQGLCELMKRAHWYHNPGVSAIHHPRSYTLTDNGDPEEFVRDFKSTAAMSLLKWIVNTTDEHKIMSDAGKVPITAFHFALKECEKFIQKFKHEDIDFVIPDALDFEWNQFLDFYYKCIHVSYHFKTHETETEQSVVYKSKIMLDKLKKYWPYLQMDGFMNIWILKPTIGSRGIGIHICRTIQYVLRVISENKTVKYIIQKYIERPLLIYKTKFDIRQWFLISCTSPLTIWIYKDLYLRFSSQTYNLRKLHESIHLTNNSVQSKYKTTNRDPGLPEYNMWDLKKFKHYLELIGYPKVFHRVIYPGMKECITAAILINQDYIHPRKNSFELYGADFMLTEDFKPWLIEINSRPALHASTPITSKMCPQVLEDCIKVLVDFARNPKSGTGNFELLYKERQVPLPPIDVSSLKIRGYPLPSEYFYTPPDETVEVFKQPERRSSDIININNTQNYMKYVSKQMKKTLQNLLEIIHKERERRQHLKIKRRDNYLTMKATASVKKNMAKENIQYIDKINKVNENIKEIQEIFKPKYMSDRNLNDIVDAIEKGSNCQLTSTSSVDHDFREECVTLCDFSQHVRPEYGRTGNIAVDLPKKSDSELKLESKKIEQAIQKMSNSSTKNNVTLFGDFLGFINMWKNTSDSKQEK